MMTHRIGLDWKDLRRHRKCLHRASESPLPPPNPIFLKEPTSFLNPPNTSRSKCRTKSPSGETASGEGSDSVIILEGREGVEIKRSSSLTVSNELRVGETDWMTVLLRWSVGADWVPRRAKTRSQSFSSTSSNSGDSSIEPNLGADLHRSTGGLSKMKNKVAFIATTTR